MNLDKYVIKDHVIIFILIYSLIIFIIYRTKFDFLPFNKWCMLLNLFQIKYARKSMAYLQIQNDILILCLGTKCVLICRLKFNYVLEPSKLLPWPDI